MGWKVLLVREDRLVTILINDIKDQLGPILNLEPGILENLSLDDDLQEYNLSSIKFIEFVIELEAKYQISIDDSDLLFDNFSSIHKIIDLLSNYVI
jgi:acyl carrier protein